MYEGAKTRIRTIVGNTEFFPMEVGLHQDLAISPYLFALILDELSRGIQENIPWCMIFADDIVLTVESAEGYEVIHQEVDIRIGDRILQPNESLDIWARVTIRLAMLYGSECWPITKAQANRVEVVELRMLRWTCGKTMVDMTSNGVFRAKLDVDSIIDKMREGRLRWFGHVKRILQTAPVMRVEALLVDGSRRRGRPKLRWEDRFKQDMKELLSSEDISFDRNAWRDKIRISGFLRLIARLKQDMKELLSSEDMSFDRNAWRDRIRISRFLRLIASFPLSA
ncbi:retrovirus-related pol polyprotein LINE-1 [Tanacetum coccineum]